MSSLAPGIILIHGAGMDHTVWRFQARWLAGLRRPVLAPDLPGHGAGGGTGLESVEDMADWVALLLPDPAVTVAGHSMGALIAMEIAVRHPELVRDLVLTGTTAPMAVHPDLMRAAAEDLPRAARLIAGWSFPKAFLGGHPQPGTWQPGATTRLVERSSPGVLAADLAACVDHDTARVASEVCVPTLVVTGAEDRMTDPAGGRRLAEAIPDADVVTMAGCGHEPMAQDPCRFNALLGERLESVGNRTRR